ncbi:MAG: MerR family transcriptional regulator [Prevotella sp.]|nr:MerR family transcriptional regulator [Prevotella sp.]
MALNLNKNLKTYYNISEVAKMIGVSEPTLRYWETEFAHLRPKTSANRVRQYTEKNIEDIKVVYNLIKVRGFKIAAARKVLSANRQPAESTTKLINKLKGIKKELEEIKLNLDMMM